VPSKNISSVKRTSKFSVNVAIVIEHVINNVSQIFTMKNI